MKREAERQQEELERARERIVKQYADKEQKLLIEYQEAKAEVERVFAKDETNRNLYLSKAKDLYDKDLAEYRSAQQEKLRSFQKDFADKIYEAEQKAILRNIGLRYGQESKQYKFAESNITTDSKRRSEVDSYNDDVQKINNEYDGVDQASQRYALLEQAKQAHVMRMQEIDMLHNEATKSLAQDQYATQLTMFGNLTGQLMGFVDESSTAYAALYAVQKGFNVAQAIMNGYTAISAAWASAPFPYNIPAVTMATMQTGVLPAMIEAVAPRGFKTGGYTGDNGISEVAGVVHGQEYVLNAQATKRVGVDTLNAINNGAEINANRVQPIQEQATSLHQSIINVVDWDEVPGVMAGPAGQKTTLNTISKNKTQIRKMLGIA